MNKKKLKGTEVGGALCCFCCRSVVVLLPLAWVATRTGVNDVASSGCCWRLLCPARCSQPPTRPASLAMQQEILAKVRRLAERVKAEPEVQK